MSEGRALPSKVRDAGGAALLATVGALLVTTGLVAWRYQPPSMRGPETSPTEFSAARAVGALQRVLDGVGPHPTGSAADAQVRERLLEELRRAGVEPVVEPAVGCRHGRCAEVRNLLARVPGRDPAAPAVLLAVHYDSVPAGPGAADDGAGVATLLEVARALRASPSLPHDVLLLVDEGEELGLLGAQAFVADASRLQRIGAVVNLEARGTGGAVSLFELSQGNANLVAEAARALPRPVTSSIFYFVYQRLPNDTDLTVFKEAGLAGVNLAFLEHPLRYHTPRDDVSHLDAGSVQQMGAQALAMVRALATGAQWHASSDDVFFDVLAWRVVRWPERWTPAMALLAAALVLATVILSRRRRAGDRRPLLAGGITLAALLLAAGLGLGVTALLRATGALPYVWVAHLAPLRVAAWAAGALAVACVAAPAAGRLTGAGAWVGVWLSWSVLAVALAFVAAPVSYLLVVPTLVAGVCGAAGALRGGPPAAWASLLPAVVALVLAGPFAWVLPAAMGASGLPAVAILVGLALSATLPALVAAGRSASLAVAGAALALLLGAFAAAHALPRFTADDPQPAALVLLHDADAQATRWVVAAAGPALPAELARAGGFGARPERAYPWPSPDAWVAPGPQVQLAPPELDVESVVAEGGNLRVRALLRSVRGAPWGELRLAAGRVLGGSVAGQPFERPPRHGPDDLLVLGHYDLPVSGVPLELTLRGTQPLHAWISDTAPGVAWAGDALLRARPASATPVHAGDRSVVVRAVTLAPGR